MQKVSDAFTEHRLTLSEVLDALVHSSLLVHVLMDSVRVP